MASALLLSLLCPTAFVGPLLRRSFLGARILLSPPPPPPFPVQPYVSHHPPYERESSFVGIRIRIRVLLAPAFLVASDTGLRPCPPPPTISVNQITYAFPKPTLTRIVIEPTHKNQETN